MIPDKQRLTATVARVDIMLHAGEYAELERFSGGVRLTAEEMKSAIEDYPEELAPRPAYAFSEGEVVYISGSAPAEWSVYLHLWRKNGGRSDLSAELTIIDTAAGLYRVQIDDIRVL
jgi:hypothetical protein